MSALLFLSFRTQLHVTYGILKGGWDVIWRRGLSWDRLEAGRQSRGSETSAVETVPLHQTLGSSGTFTPLDSSHPGSVGIPISLREKSKYFPKYQGHVDQKRLKDQFCLFFYHVKGNGRIILDLSSSPPPLLPRPSLVKFVFYISSTYVIHFSPSPLLSSNLS